MHFNKVLPFNQGIFIERFIVVEQILGGRRHGTGVDIEGGRDLDGLKHVIFMTMFGGICGA